MPLIRILAPDAVGIVSRLAQTVNQHQGNWLESGVSRISGQLVGLVRISVPEQHKKPLQQALQNLSHEWQIDWYDEDQPDSQETRFTLQLLGDDQPGIVDQLARRVRDAQASIIRLQSRVYEAPMSNELLFEATMEVSCQPDQLAPLRQSLEVLGDSLMVDIKTRHDTL